MRTSKLPLKKVPSIACSLLKLGLKLLLALYENLISQYAHWTKRFEFVTISLQLQLCHINKNTFSKI